METADLDMPGPSGLSRPGILPPLFDHNWRQPGEAPYQAPDRAGSLVGHPSGFPSVGETAIPNVSPLTTHVFPFAFYIADAKYHLTVLRRFCDLFTSVESTATNPDDKAQLVQQFLVCAEARYIRYLALLDEDASDFSLTGEDGSYNQTMPLPPWYYCVIRC